MASDIEIGNINNFEKIQNFLNDSAYKEILENSENFNTRLCIERRLRMPFLDPQTGVAQTHCALFMKQRQRMPGFRDGQIYTYPSARWRKPKRQYLLNHHHSYRAYQYREPHYHQSTGNSSAESAAIVAADGNSMSASGDNDSKDSHANAEKDWFHEDIDMSHYHHVDDFEEDFESDNDFDESYSSRGKRKRGTRSGRRSTVTTDGTPKRGRKSGSRRRNNADGEGGGGGGRRRGGGAGGGASSSNANTAAAAAAAAAAVAAAASAVASTMEASNSNSASPIGTNDETSQSAIVIPPGTPTTATTFHKTLSENSSGSASAGAAVPSDATATTAQASTSSAAPTSVTAATTGTTATTTATTTAATVAPTAVIAAAAATTADAALKKDLKCKLRPDREVATPSTYCDFCLGDQRENKKTNLPEELVSCSDCGRSGHPSCLQFTPNMIISVKRYRWQCIECKYCSICGTSDNDDQLLFCDDCDRGYHMYCLSPPLITPPEGSWSCKLCMDEFHKDEK
ncbi:zinc finger protein ubi-d4 B [Eurosta solidaginis]|uniref:zinc finger protein ubi-d4 B n=1 Tax=Eurosta solidaginis TaxID=178769 RepID=UPI003531675B